jgi:ElaB/YqjD/DUF883 family membrane-anchored ribosome-binding protein
MITRDQFVDNAGEVIRDQYDRISTEAKKRLECTAKSVGRRPFESLAMAVGTGVIAGVLLGISMSKRKHAE